LVKQLLVSKPLVWIFNLNSLVSFPIRSI
jgi:hypothetical protein